MTMKIGVEVPNQVEITVAVPVYELDGSEVFADHRPLLLESHRLHGDRCVIDSGGVKRTVLVADLHRALMALTR